MAKEIRIGILGSTGSIGRNSLDVIRNLKKNNFDIEVVFLSANNNIELLAEQTDEFKPKIVYLENSNKEKDFKKSIKTNCKVVTGEDKLIELARRDDYDMLIVAVVGFYGLLPTIEAIKAKKRIAIANKDPIMAI